MSFRKMAGFAGIVSVVFFVASFVAYGSLPDIDATAAQVATYIADTGSLALGNLFGALAGFFMLIFLVGFALPFKASDREHNEGFGTVIVAMGVVAATAIGIGVAFFAVLSNRIEAFDDATVWSLWDGGNLMYSVSQMAFFFGACAAAIAIMKHGVMAKWFGMLTAVATLLSLGGFVGFFSNGSGAVTGALLAYAGILVWLLSGGIVLVRSKS